jgi:hypothetical protein
VAGLTWMLKRLRAYSTGRNDKKALHSYGVTLRRFTQWSKSMSGDPLSHHSTVLLLLKSVFRGHH